MKPTIIQLIVLSAVWAPSAYFLTELERRVESMTGVDIEFQVRYEADPAPETNTLDKRAERLYSLRKISPRAPRKIHHYLTDLLDGFWFAGRAPICLYKQSYPASFSTVDVDYEELSIRAAAQEIGHDLGLGDGPPCTGMDDNVLSCDLVDYSLQNVKEISKCLRKRRNRR